MRARVRTWGLAAALLGIIAVLDVANLGHLSITYDEPRHFLYGQHILKGDSSRFDDSKMPVSALNALPGRLVPSLDTVEAGRYVTVLFSLLVALLVFTWARQLYGDTAGLLALTLYTFDPNLLAHAQLVTTDIFALGTITCALFAFWRYLHSGNWRTTLVAGLALGVAQVAKYTALALFPLFVVIALLFHARDIRREVRAYGRGALWGRALRFMGPALVMVAVSLLVINVAFLFNRTGMPLGDYVFRSATFTSLQASSGVLGILPLPLPHPYLEGLDWIIQRERTGEGYGHIYLLGTLRAGEGFPGYYLVASMFKVPLGTLLLLAAAIAAWVARVRRGEDVRNDWVLVVPASFYVVYFNFFYRAQIGFRYYLVVFPLLYVLTGGLLREGQGRPRGRMRVLSVALASVVLSVLSWYPHFLPYFNELIGNRRLSYRVLADSNIDWGQHRWYLKQYMASHPGAIIEPDGPTAGTILVGVNALTGVAGDPGKFKWLRDNFTPVDDIAHSVLVYRVSPQDLERLGR
ncbi:MAG: glycosyltransferase family 39 protein [Vicinamibacterales bacterium]